jgi:hypothetical protein
MSTGFWKATERSAARQAEQKAIAEYEKFNKQQRIESDFDREVKRLLQKKGAERMSDYKTIAESNNFIVLDKYTREWKVAEGYQSESDLERELIQDLVNQGYEFLPTLNTPKPCWPMCACSCRRSTACSLPTASGALC